MSKQTTKRNNQIEELEASFSDKVLYKQALTHRSWINENPGKRESNERLEFLGDAVLEYVVSSRLYRELPDKEEGFLTALRANIVNTKNLASLAQRLKLGETLFMSKGEAQGGGRDNPALLANTVEAVIGAVYIDQGLERVSKFIAENILYDLEEKLQEPLKDPKSRLQEAVQSEGFEAPIYKVKKESGPDHDKEFWVEVMVGGKVAALGTGKSKNQAEQTAAAEALDKLESER